MQRRFLIIAVFLILFIAGPFLVLLRRTPAEPSFQGKRFSEWVQPTATRFARLPSPSFLTLSDLRSNNPELVRVMRGMGTNSIPYLLHELQSTDSTLTRHVVLLLRRWEIGSFSLAEERRARARNGLVLLGETATNALPQFEALLHQPYAIEVVTIFDSMDLAGVRGLVTAVTRAKDPFARQIAAWLLGRICHRDMHGAVDALLSATYDSDPDAQREAVSALGRFQSESHRSLPVLEKMRGQTREGDPLHRALDGAIHQLKATESRFE